MRLPTAHCILPNMYLPIIGLEIHAELKTRTKMFCCCANNPDETMVNANVCPVCMAHPGVLPVINREAVRHILRIGASVGGEIANFSEFDRKSYFYPDIPKGYQISQYIHPLVTGGSLAGVKITRIHLEEDTARAIHSKGESLVDFNRAGIPLMELVTEPVIHDAETAGRFAKELQLLLRTLQTSDANLEKGEMRIEANISVSKQDAVDNKQLGTKVEVKNLNSFRSVERAIAYEIKRQIDIKKEGKEVVQETRGWNEKKQLTFHQRLKEGSADYRYFPEPDLPKLFLSEISELSPYTIRASLPELPWNRRDRYINTYAIKTEDATYLCATISRVEFFDAVATALTDSRELIPLAVNYIVSDLAGIHAKKDNDEDCIAIDPIAFSKLIRLIGERRLSSRGAKDTLSILVDTGGDPEIIAQERGFLQIHDSDALGLIVDKVLAMEYMAVSEYKRGKQTVLQHLIGMAMKESGGAGNPNKIKELILQKINSK